MISIAKGDRVGQLPVKELQAAVETFMEPVLVRLPEKRLRVVGVLMILGILAGQSPLITQMARGVGDGSRYGYWVSRRWKNTEGGEKTSFDYSVLLPKIDFRAPLKCMSKMSA